MRLVAEGLGAKRGEDLIFQDISFEIEGGEALVVKGANGSGKSTLLRGMARLQRLSAGSVTLDDGDATVLSAREFARRVTLLAQSRPTPAGITVRDAVEFGRHPHRHGWRGLDPETSEPWFQLASAVIIIGLALWMPMR